MKNTGMIAAVEIDAVKEKYGEPAEMLQAGGFPVYHYVTDSGNLYILHSGPGEISAAAGTQALISEFHVSLITNFGVVGGLSEEMSKVRLCIVDKVVHYQFDTSEVDHCEPGLYLNEYPTIYMPADRNLLARAKQVYPDLKPVICASGDKFVGSVQEKTKIHEQFHADICEMESAGIVKTANRNKVPCVLIKMVADSITGGEKEYFSAFDESSRKALDVLDTLIQNL